MTGTDLVRALDELLEKGAHSAEDLSTDEAQELALLASTAEGVRELGPGAQVRPEFRKQLAAQLAAAPAPRSVAGRREQRRAAHRWGRRTAFAGAALVAMIAFASVGAVRASAGALPGERLYPVKRIVEETRLAFAGANALSLHLELAAIRLSEAVAVPGAAGELLAEFSHQVTSALASADAAFAAGTPREDIAPPLLEWLLDARGEMVAYRESMPPIAWRSSLALIDEAIAALRSGDAVALRPVPRMERTDLLLARWALTKPWDRPVGGGAKPPVVIASSDGSGRGARSETIVRIVGGPGSPSGGAAGAGGGAGDAPVLVPTLVPPTERPPRRGNPQPTDAPAPTVSVPSPTDLPGPTSEPSPLPSEVPSPTVIPANQPPVIVAAWCVPNPVLVHSSARCALEVQDPDNTPDQLTYQWSADLGEMLQATSRSSIYYASFEFSFKETTTWITARATDPDGAVGELRFEMKVVNGEQGGAPRQQAGP